MWAPIAAILIAVGAFSTPKAIDSEHQWLAQHKGTESTQLNCMVAGTEAQKTEQPC